MKHGRLPGAGLKTGTLKKGMELKLKYSTYTKSYLKCSINMVPKKFLKKFFIIKKPHTYKMYAGEGTSYIIRTINL